MRHDAFSAAVVLLAAVAVGLLLAGLAWLARLSCCWPWVRARWRLWDEAREARAQARAGRRRAARRRDYARVVEAKSVCLAFEDLEAGTAEEGGAGLELPLMRSQQRSCVICLAEYANEDALRQLLPCEHLYHRECVDNWFKAKRRAVCPICNLPLDDRELVPPGAPGAAWRGAGARPADGALSIAEEYAAVPAEAASSSVADERGAGLQLPDAALRPPTDTCLADGTPMSQASTSAGSPSPSSGEDAQALLAGAALRIVYSV